MHEFEGKLFDGQTSAGIPVSVQFGNQELILNPQNTESEQSWRWQTSEIHPNDFNDNEMTVLKYGSFPFKYLEVSADGFTESLKAAFPDAAFTQSAYRRFFKLKSGYLAGALVLLVALVGSLYFFLIPRAAEMVAGALPQQTEQMLGNSLVKTLLTDEEIDSVKTKQAQLFFNRLFRAHGKQAHVTVVESSQPNAFAVPGGHIIINKPILQLCSNYQQLAALLAHEQAHLQHRHSLRAMFRNLSSYLVLSALFSDVNGLMAIIIENGNMLKSLEFTRELEREADLTGLHFLTERGLDPQGMVTLFNALKKEQRHNGLPEFVSTHPVFDSRIKYLQEEIGKKKFVVQPDDSLAYYFNQLKM